VIGKSACKSDWHGVEFRATNKKIKLVMKECDYGR
jgi:hypothetical protein